MDITGANGLILCVIHVAAMKMAATQGKADAHEKARRGAGLRSLCL
ncbi:hypothetical protein ACIKTA_06830 [Hansschlegelia beijingensis]